MSPTHRTPRSVQTIVDQQVRQWSLGESSGSKKQTQWPLITVSRESGTLGAEIGEQVAERLGFAFWDRQIVHSIAKESKMEERLLSTLDDGSRTLIENMVADLIYGIAGIEAEYVRQIGRIVGAIEHHGSAVVVGRGAQYLVADDKVLRVRIVCPLEQRAERHAEREGDSVEHARKAVRRTDAERRSFIRDHFQRDVTEAEDYDIIVNSGTYSIDDCVELVLEAYRRKFGELPQP